ncbi:uncharacterized protein LOC120625148 [Pararge aegeria]|uniref:Jg4198 protein n=1 Tax=Pararge aegeria aegeria TaxID=348720 RepID=A0A8S4R5R9_9NEOP|nr:uncharacterized protein LOC120625148 [Pararge aegeria]CAH2230645.1 jg4198 [Pararge aegeria aegeria]
MDKVDNQSMTDEYLEKYAAEFCMHEELMKPARNTKSQSWARKQALSKLGAVFDCTELKMILREVRAFKQQCVNKMRLLVRQAHGSGDGALALAPPWLQKLNRPFDLVTAALKLESLYEGPQTHGPRVNQFTWDLYCSVRTAVQAASCAHDAAALLRNGAVAEFAEQKGLGFETVRDIWRRVYDSALVKLRDASRAGDRPVAAGPKWLDWRIIDLALLYSRENVVVRLSFSNPAEVEAMLQLYKLMSEAHAQLEKARAYDQSTTATTTTTTTTAGIPLAEEARTATDQTQIERQVENGAQNGITDRNGTGPSCSSAGDDGTANPVPKKPPDELVWESADTWTKLHADYCKSRRAVSLVTLQRRWFELKVLARRGILFAAKDPNQAPHPLLLAIVKRFPHVVTLPPVSWSQLVEEKRIYVDDFVTPVQTESTKTEDPNPALTMELIDELLEWSDDEPEIVETDQNQCIQIDSDTEQDADLPTDKTLGALNTELHHNDTITLQDTNTTSKECTPTEETSTVTISDQLDNRYTNTTIETQTAHQQHSPQLDGIDAKLKENPENIIEPIIPTKSKSRIKFEDEDDLDQLCNFDTNHESLSMLIDQMVNTNYKTKPIEKDKSVEVKHEKEPDKSTSHPSFNVKVKMEPVEHSVVNSESVTSNSELPQKSNDEHDRPISVLKQMLLENDYRKVPNEFNDTLYTQAEKEAVSTCGEKIPTEVNSDLSEQCSEDGSACNYIDEKLLKLSRVVLIPLEQIPAWQFARGTTIDCRRFCVERFSAPVALSPRQLNGARRYRPVWIPSDDAPPGVSRVLQARFSDMPHEYKVIRRKLMSRLRLSRTSLSTGFWSCERNVALLRQCKPVHVAIARLARVVKRVELADIEEVRRMNRSILTAQVAPISVESQNDPNIPSDTSALPSWDIPEAGGSVAPPPSVKEIRKMIKTLAIPSITAMRLANANLQAQSEHERIMLNYREEERARAQRDENKRLDGDIRHLVRSLGEGECQQKAKKIVKKVLVLSEDEKPLPDAYQEWQRQKTLVHKYFNFHTPQQAGNKTTASKVLKTGTKDDSKTNTYRNKIDLMSVSDDEESLTRNDLIGDLKKENQSVNDAKRSRSDKETSHSFKRVKLAQDTAQNDNADKSTKDIAQNINDGKDQSNDNDSDDENRMIIDEGIEDCCNEDDTLILTDPLPTRPSYLADSQLTVWPSNAVSRLDEHHDTSKNIVYVIKSTKKDYIAKGLTIIPTTSIINTVPRTDSVTLNTALMTPVNTGVVIIATTSTPNTAMVLGGTSFRQTTFPTTCINTDAIPTASAFNTFKLPDDVSLTLNTPVTTSVNTMLPKLSFIKSGTETIRKESAPIKAPMRTPRPTQPKSAPISPSKRKHTDREILKRSRPGPLSSKPKIISIISQATTKEGFSSNTPLSKGDETIDHEGAFAANDATKKQLIPRIVSTASLKQIVTEINKPSTAEIDPGTNTDAKENHSMPKISDNPKYLTSNKTENNELPFPTMCTTQTLCLEVGPIQRHSDISKPVNIITSNKTNDVRETICLDSDDSDEIKKFVDCTSIKKGIIEVDSSSNESESRFVEPPSEINAADLVPPKTIFEGQDSDLVLKASVTKVAQKTRNAIHIPAKITANTTSKELLRLPPDELARLLEDDGNEADTDMTREKKTETSTNTTPRAFLPIKIKKEKRWAQELSIGGRGSEKVCTKGAVIKNEPGVTPKTNSTGKDGVPAETAELFLQGVPSASVMKSTLPDVICSDVLPEEYGDERNFLTICDFAKTEIDVMEYVRQVQDPEEPLLKVDLTQPLWLLADKYLLLTDAAVNFENPIFVTSHRAGTLAPYCAVRFPDRTNNKQILNLGAKKGRDVMICGCNGKNSCLLCQSIGEQDGRAPEFMIYKPKFRKVCHACGVDPKSERARLFTIKQRPYRKIGDRPLKFVMVDVSRLCGVCRDGAQFVARPDALLINSKHYEKISDEPLMYAPVLCVLQSAESAARLTTLDSELFLLNVHTARWNRVLFRPDGRFGPFNAAVRTLMTKMDREEVDAWYRRKLDSKHGAPL